MLVAELGEEEPVPKYKVGARGGIELCRGNPGVAVVNDPMPGNCVCGDIRVGPVAMWPDAVDGLHVEIDFVAPVALRLLRSGFGGIELIPRQIKEVSTNRRPSGKFVKHGAFRKV